MFSATGLLAEREDVISRLRRGKSLKPKVSALLSSEQFAHYMIDAPVAMVWNDILDVVNASMASYPDTPLRESDPIWPSGLIKLGESDTYALWAANHHGVVAGILGRENLKAFYWRNGDTSQSIFSLPLGDGDEDLGPEEDLYLQELSTSFLHIRALWAFMRTPLVDISHRSGSREDRRRAEREGRPMPDVRVIQLRARHVIHSHPSDTKGETEYNCRWLVRGHWHGYWCGSGSEKHVEPRFVGAYVKGPDDKPLKRTIDVFAVVR